MHAAQPAGGLPKTDVYVELKQQLTGLLEGEPDGLPNCANATALLYHALPALNWVGFYFLRAHELVLGPFQGKIACVRIGLGTGVCGTAAERRQTLIVPDVQEFPGHIACDAASRSEIVVPMVKSGHLLGVLDIDSPELDRFDRDDARGLEALVELLLERSEFDRLAG
ncbi:MAG TPA: GAF domain-containing protein [Steroidobacteraceae bacterium]|nr:GAF domain-containing protein [Steroidobacteraceae bacterium]